MPPALRAFLDGLIDYAGLFPPADLDLDPALDLYARYRLGDDAWMLGRFIVPARRLPALDAFRDRFAQVPPFAFSVLGLPAEGRSTPDAALATLAAARAFEHRHHGCVVADRFEFRLTPGEAADLGGLGDLFGAVGEHLDEREGAPARAFFEVPLLDDAGQGGAETAAQAMADYNAAVGRPAVGVKLRCGGVTPDAFPGVEALAGALAACRDAGAPFKATAGLHHPLRHYSDAVGAPMHGFLNVFGGAVLARACDLDRATLERLLADENPDHFAFTDDGFSWLDAGADAEAVAEARAALATSYGSCSFDEPREDLHALGLLGSVAV